jgi:putative glutamine amidotransferase
VLVSPTVVRREEVEPVRRGPGDGPRVAVVVSLNVPGADDHVADLMRSLTRCALEQLDRLGADARLVDTSGTLPAYAEALDADAVLVLGGGDVDSELYGVPGPVPGEYGVDAEADRWSLELVRAAVEADLPLLAVCRGVQLLNVAFGGTLVPDLDPPGPHKGPSGALFVDEVVEVEAGTRLAGILGAGPRTVRAGHHQAVDRVAPALRRSAVAVDGVVEAVEHPAAWAVGVQWHPEEEHADPVDRVLLWRALVTAASTRAARGPVPSRIGGP